MRLVVRYLHSEIGLIMKEHYVRLQTLISFYCLPMYGMHIHEACRSGLTYPITQNLFTLLLEPQVDARSYSTLLAPSTMTRASVQRHTTQMMFATRFTRRIRYKRMH